MKILDLHGVKHADVEDLIVKACASSDVPFIVITGKSNAMKKLVGAAARLMNLDARDAIDNPGRIIIDEPG
tara:strand:- start:6879 stop:7091 length:213 start_codon:yes stop_codon:yes gene_type:complete